MSRRKVVTEITIETTQVLVIKRRQVTRSRWSECTREADFVTIDKVNVPVDETRNRQGVEAFPGTPHFAGAADGSYTLSLRSWLRRNDACKTIPQLSKTRQQMRKPDPEVKVQKSKGVDKV